MSIPFLAFGIPIIIFLFAVRARRKSRILPAVASLLGIVLLAGVVMFFSEPTVLSGEAWYERSPWKEALLLVTMLSGMAARSLNQAIEVRSQRIAQLRAAGKLRRKPKLSLDPWDSLRPFLVALPTFGGLLGQVGDQAMGWVLIVLAFQTGFFWQTILNKSAPSES